MLTVNTIIADKQSLFCEGLKSILNQHPAYQFNFIAEVDQSDQVTSLVSTQDVDILILDLDLTGIDGLALIPSIKSISSEVKIVVLTTYRNYKFVKEAMKGGADAYLLKSSSIADMHAAINSVFADKTYLGPDVNITPPSGFKINSEANSKFEDRFLIRRKLHMRMVTNTYKTLRNIPTMTFMFIVGLFASNAAVGQCPMVCNNLIQVSVDSDCSATITPDMVLEGVDEQIADMSCEFLIVLYDEDGVEFDRSMATAVNSMMDFTYEYPSVGNAYVGQTIEIGIWADNVIDAMVDVNTANNCWSNAAIEDKIPNALACPSVPIEIPCYEELTAAEIMAAATRQSFNVSGLALPIGSSVAIMVPVANSAAEYEQYHFARRKYCCNNTDAYDGLCNLQ